MTMTGSVVKVDRDEGKVLGMTIIFPEPCRADDLEIGELARVQLGVGAVGDQNEDA